MNFAMAWIIHEAGFAGPTAPPWQRSCGGYESGGQHQQIEVDREAHGLSLIAPARARPEPLVQGTQIIHHLLDRKTFLGQLLTAQPQPAAELGVGS